MHSPGSRFGLVVTDLDNTLYDWVGFYVPAFLALVEEVQRISGIDAPTLIESFGRVHKRYGTTEYAFALQELDALPESDRALESSTFLRRYDAAIHAFRRERRRRLVLYSGVRETLERLKDAGVTIVAHSDSLMGYVSRRLRQLDIDTMFAAIAAPEDHGVPATIPKLLVRRSSLRDVESRTQRIILPPGATKPRPESLTPVLDAFGVSPDRALYVGNSLSRDVLLARRCGLTDVWAAYGEKVNPALYEVLLRITYWTDAEVAEEQRLRDEVATKPPSHTIDQFADLLPLMGLAPSSSIARTKESRPPNS